MLVALSDPVQLALIAALVTVVPSIMGVITLVINLRAASQTRRAAAHVRQVRRDLIRENKIAKVDREKVAAAVSEVHEETKAVLKATNGMKDELVNEVRKASFAAGVKSEADKTEHSVATDSGQVEKQANVIGSAIATALEKNVEVVKKDVNVIKGDVKAVKAEVIKKEDN